MDNATDSLDPLASILRDDIGIKVDGFGELVIPYRPAAVWLRPLFTNPDPVSVILAVAGHSNLSRALLRGTVGVDQLKEPCQLLVEAASGRHWWVVANLVSVARASWDVIGGRLAMAGIDPSQIPLGVWLDAVWIIMLEAQADQTAVDKLRLEMGRRPTTGQETEDDLAVSEEEFDRVVAMAQSM